MALNGLTAKRVGVSLAAAAIAGLVELSPAMAAEESSEKKEKEGKALELDFKPGECVITIRNQSSVHADTKVEVKVGDKVYTLEDVEGEADKVTTSETITVGDDGASAYVIYGPDKISSLKSEDVSCEAPKPKPVVATPTYTG